MKPLGIDGAYVAESPLHTDERGSFREWYWEATLPTVAQANCATSRADTIRGIHFQPGQEKYIACVEGSVLDVVVDIRPGSPTYGQWRWVHLSASDSPGRTVVISAGLGHAYMAITDATLAYLCSQPHDPSTEGAISPLDPALAIPWPLLGHDPIMSAKDRAAPTLAEAARLGILPA